MPRSQVTPAGKVAREYCEKFPDVPSRTLARTLNEQRPKLFPSVEQARRFVRDVRGNRGTQARLDVADKTLFRPNGKAGMVLMPEPVVETWEPLRIDGPARVGVLSDIHVPYHDKSALETAVKECKRHKCDTIIFNGDQLDFYGISRFEKDPERRAPSEEIRNVVQLMRYVQQQFPKARLIWRDGNHEDRWAKWCWANAPVLWALKQCRLDGVLGNEYAEQTGNESTKLARYGWEYLSEKRPILAGHLPIMHGHELNVSSASVSAARGAWLKATHTVMIGHLHSTSAHPQPDMFHNEIFTWSVGALCQLTPLYARTNKWNNGVATVDISADGDFDVRNMRIRDGKIRSS
jgi:predicted phosphodiesterase